MIKETFSSMVLQPATVCNLDCGYCYLSTRHFHFKMSVKIAKLVAKSIESLNFDHPINLIWHAGEPLATGIKHFTKLVEVFELLRSHNKISHSIQTNATLITNDWCSLFRKYDFHVGVSIDGPEWATVQRVDLVGKPSFQKIMNGINTLTRNGMSFNVIAVIHKHNIRRPEELYDFFSNLGCHSLAINMEEIEGANSSQTSIDDYRVFDFWMRLYKAWIDNPVIRIREFDASLSYIRSLLHQSEYNRPIEIDLFPTVNWKGDVFLLSPELAGVRSEKYEDFIVGNLQQKSLPDILRAGLGATYLSEYHSGVSRCKSECEYFDFCGGGYASNKFFEFGNIDQTETLDCRNSRIRLLDAILEID